MRARKGHIARVGQLSPKSNAAGVLSRLATCRGGSTLTRLSPEGLVAGVLSTPPELLSKRPSNSSNAALGWSTAAVINATQESRGASVEARMSNARQVGQAANVAKKCLAGGRWSPKGMAATLRKKRVRPRLLMHALPVRDTSCRPAPLPPIALTNHSLAPLATSSRAFRWIDRP